MPELHNKFCAESDRSIVASFRELIYCHELTQHVRDPTRQGKILDLVFSSKSDLIRNLQILPPVGYSDHSSVAFEVSVYDCLASPVYRRVFSACNFKDLTSDLSRIRWVELFETCNNVNEKYELLLSVLHTAIDYYVPWRKEASFKSVPLPGHLQKMSEHRDCLFLEARRTGNWSAYRRFTDIFLTRLKKFNRCVEKKIVEAGCSGSFYKYLNSKIQDKKCIGSLESGGVMVYRAQDKANVFADQFSKSFLNDDGIVPEFTSPLTCSMKEVPWFHADRLYEQIMGWPKSSSITPDFIPLSFIQQVAAVICGPLAYLFNQSLMRGEVPRRWKHSFVTPVLKKEPSSDPANYRPVSITSLFCRLFEKTIKAHILEYVAACHIIPKAQHGFIPGRSVETNMIECLEDWTSGLDNNCCSDVVYFDFAKAFDRVSHKKLLYKLTILGFHPVLVRWVSSFLSGRTFQVRVGHTYSEIRDVLSGVPQGGVLSPVLFNIFTSEIPSLFDGLDVRTKMYADDVKIYKTITQTEDTEDLQQAITLLNDWTKLWQLPLAPHKTMCMRIGASPELALSPYVLDGVTISHVDVVRDLGFTYTNTLDFSTHIRNRCKLARLRTFHIFKGLSSTNKSVLLRAYKTYIRPLLESGATVFHPIRKKDADAIEKVQNNFTRKILLRTGSFLLSRIPKAVIRNKYFNLSTLESRRKVFDVCMVYKLLYQCNEFGPFEIYKTVRSRTRGGPIKIFLARPRTNVRAKSFTFRAGSLFNKVTRRFVIPGSSKVFKRYVAAALSKASIS
ncbi:hypothetical protein V3C99_001991 [Haemonchus contortus]